MRLLVANYHARLVGGVETYLRAVLPRLSGDVHTVGLLRATQLSHSLRQCSWHVAIKELVETIEGGEGRRPREMAGHAPLLQRGAA